MSAEGLLEHARRLDTDEIKESGSKPQEEERVCGVMHLSAIERMDNPIFSHTVFLLETFTILTAADQNNTYLFMYASRNHM